MQGHKGRITKKELKEDEFVTRAVQVSEYIQGNYPKVLAAIGALVIVILIGVFIRDEINRGVKESVEAFGAARVTMMSGNIEEALRLAEGVVSDYAGKPAASHATLFLGDVNFGQQEWARARSHYETYLAEYGSEGPVGYGAWTGVAACLEELGNVSEAGNKYLAYVDRHATSAFAPIALSEAARCFNATGDAEKAEGTLRRILDEYPESVVARSAKPKLALMGTTPE